MKQLFYIITLAFVFISCKKENDTLFQNKVEEETAVSSGIEVAAYKWYQMPVPTISNPSNTSNMIVQVNGDTYALAGGALTSWYKLNNNTKRWETTNGLNVFGGFGTGQQYFFSYQSKVYFGMNRTNDSIDHRFIAADAITNTYSYMAAFPGIPVTGPTCFVIGNKGYIMGGTNHGSYPVNQLWEYNFTTNTWTNKGSSPLSARASATAMVVGDKAYLGLGYRLIVSNNQLVKDYKNDWVIYDPIANSSTVMASFPAAKRADAKGFVLGSSIFIGFGRSTTINSTFAYNDFYRYSTTNNEWTVQSFWPSSIGNSYGTNIATFAVGNKGYLLKGNMTEFWCFSNTPIIQQQ